MCEKAEEIQKIAPKVEDDSGYGSFFFNADEDSVNLHHYDNDEGCNIIGGYYARDERQIWLPRQDQLQKMIGDKPAYQYPLGKCIAIQKFAFSNDAHALFSMEQLWLAFVMFERYKKKWTGSEWK
jgi:hypothetical protein